MPVNIRYLHDWNLPPSEAKKVQIELADQVDRKTRLGKITYVAGIDVGFDLKRNIGKSAVVVLNYPDLELVESVKAELELTFPYIPGLLSFREIPVIVEALKKVSLKPDVILCDGQGIAHPRRFGLACHLGLLTDIPTIGVAKSRLIGNYRDLGNEKGSMVSLNHDGEIIGMVVRTRRNVNPLFISIGHKIDLNRSIQVVWDCITKYRLPETTRQAHKFASYT